MVRIHLEVGRRFHEATEALAAANAAEAAAHAALLVATNARQDLEAVIAVRDRMQSMPRARRAPGGHAAGATVAG